MIPESATTPAARAAALPAAVREIYPWTPKAWTGLLGTQAYLDEGNPADPVPVVLLHGNPTWSFLWRDLMKVLLPGRRCIVPDHLGMGLSDRPAAETPVRLADHVAHVEGILAQAGVERFDLVVHDWGGAIGAGVATRNPGRLRRWVVTNTAAWPSARIPWQIALCRAGSLGTVLVRGLDVFAGPCPNLGVVSLLSDAVKLGYRAPYTDWRTRRQVRDFIADIPMEADHPSRPELECIASGLPSLAAKPMLIVWGSRDFCFDDRFLAEWRERFPAADVHRHPEAGHLVLEDAGFPSHAAIAAFLNRPD